MSNFFTPRSDQYLRVRYRTDTQDYVLEQQFRRNPNGVTDPAQLAAILGLNEDQWEERGIFRDLFTVTEQTVYLMYDENVTIVSFDSGLVSTGSGPMLRVRAQLQRLLA